MRQGRIYFPPIKLPPGQETEHRIVVLTNSHLINKIGANQFLVCALIRSATNKSGQRVSLIPGHTIPVNPLDFIPLSANQPVIYHDSLIETHQLFHISKQSLSDPSVKALGDLKSEKLHEVLAGSQRLFR